jgi:molybdate transport system regulatory protein
MAARRHRLEPAKLRILFGPEIAMGPGKADLLEAIADTGSIAAAGRRFGMSYRRAWTLVDTMNRCFREPVVAAGTGGAGGGGAVLTPFGLLVLDRFRALEAAARASLEEPVAGFAELLADAPAPARKP